MVTVDGRVGKNMAVTEKYSRAMPVKPLQRVKLKSLSLSIKYRVEVGCP